MYLLTTAVVLVLAVFAHAEADQQYRVVRTVVTCNGNATCPSHDTHLTSGCLEITYGVKREDLKGRFCAEYLPSGLVDITVEANGTLKNPVGKSHVYVGPTLSPTDKCVREETLSPPKVTHRAPPLDGINFQECGFDQTFIGNQVHRSITVRVYHHFHTGVSDSLGNPVWFIGYRYITVDFYLAPIHDFFGKPEETIINPPNVTVDAELSVCLALGHKLEVFKSPYPYFWHIKVSTVDDYVRETFGLGFKLTKCWVRPYLADGVTLGNNVVFLDEDHLDSAVLFNNPIVPNENSVRGEKYEFSFGQITDASLTNAMLHPDKLHKVYCNVCLCPLEGPADKRCPEQIPTRTLVHGVPNPLVEGGSGGRSGIQARSFRPLYEEALLVGGHARQV